MSTDGGYTFDTVLLENTANDGEAIMSNITSYQTRFKVKGSGSIFFDISNINTALIYSSGVEGCTDLEACFDGKLQLMINSVDTLIQDLTAVATSHAQGDINNNGVIDVGDVLAVLGDFGCTSSCESDVNGDGVVTVADILLLLSSFGPSLSLTTNSIHGS